MKMKIIGVDNSQNFQDLMVEFTSPFGVGKANWKGKIPQLMKEYDVEFDIEDLVWGVNIWETPSEEFKVFYEDEILTLQGKLENVDSDNFVIIRLGDSIIALTVMGASPPLGCFVKLASKKATIYDSNL